jgi:hypothetical protein
MRKAILMILTMASTMVLSGCLKGCSDKKSHEGHEHTENKEEKEENKGAETPQENKEEKQSSLDREDDSYAENDYDVNDISSDKYNNNVAENSGKLDLDMWDSANSRTY